MTPGSDNPSADPGLQYRWRDGVATVTIDRPRTRNSQLPETWRSLARIGAELPSGTRVVIVTGAGGHFSSGLDRSALSAGSDSVLGRISSAPDTVAHQLISEFQDGFSWLADPSFVSIASVAGHAVGAGFQLALACDLIVAAEDAQFCMAEVTLGLVPDLGGTGRLVRAVGAARALEICATGRRVGGAEAVRIGLALLAVPVAELAGTVADLVASLTASETAAVRAVTRLIAHAERNPPEDQLAAERSEQLMRLRELAARI